jgi:flagellar motor switch protein FliG
MQAQIVEGDLVTQAIQALPAMYNSTVANFIKAEQHTARAVTLSALQKVVSNYYAIATKGKQGPK